MAKEKSKPDVQRDIAGALNELSWKLEGIGHFIGNIDEQAAPTHKEYFGMGLLIASLAKDAERILADLEEMREE